MRQLFTVDSAATRQHLSSSRTHTSTLRWTLVALVLSATLLTTKAAAAAEELVLADEDALVDAPTITSVSSNGVAVPQMDAVVLPDELLQATNPPSADVGIAILAGTIQPSGAPTSGVASTLHAGGSLAVAFTMAFLLMASAILPLGHF